jgi:hypothetical protein
MTKHQTGPYSLPPFEKFQAQFRLAFGRELTREERRFYRLIQIVLEEHGPHTPAASTDLPIAKTGN